jgi:hypothetical protein
MAAFNKGQQARLKGAQITLADAVSVVELKKSRIIFESSTRDKVICDLASSAQNARMEFVIGSPVTVVGTVRGRGLLGNVTLDQCSLQVISETILLPPDPDIQEPEPAMSEFDENILYQDAAVAPPPPPQEDLQTPVEITAPVAPKAARPVLREKAAEPPSPPPAVSAAPQEISSPPNISSEALEPLPLDSVEQNRPYPLYAFLAVLSGLGFITLLKFRSAVMPRLRPSSEAPTEEVRRAALEALLLTDKNRK